MEDMKILHAGETALVCQFGTEISEEINDRVHALAEAIKKAGIEGVTELQPTFRSLLVCYDPKLVCFAELSEKLKDLTSAKSGAEEASYRTLRIPCCYGGHFGPELGLVAERAGLTRDEVIAIHSGTDYRVYMLGFLPGFVYLGGLDKRIETPRLKTPRLAIPAGAVGIGGNQTGVYPVVSPGGWNIIGGTPLDFYDPASASPILCRAGDRIRFVPITSCDYYDIRQEMMKGELSWRLEL
ncbi:MAG: 5-oxoprolinase subunit PxpB [Firmicutes bacterium]|nr:5-oxoprolinase subunit PxpB [Bacillota bacterium]